MKKKIIKELKAFMAMAIYTLGLFSFALICLFRFNRMITVLQLIGGIGIIITTLILDIRYINKHWDGREWI